MEGAGEEGAEDEVVNRLGGRIAEFVQAKVEDELNYDV